VLLLPGLDINRAQLKVNEIRKSLRKIQVGTITMSSSFGIAELQPNDNFSNLFERADRALYLSKSKGGNQISLG
jgi:PleD family two-component response regulator